MIYRVVFNEFSKSTQSIDVQFIGCLNISHVMRKPAFCLCENKGADQHRGDHAADHRFCFCYIDNTIPQLPKFKISSL